jgi:hypothetical protein
MNRLETTERSSAKSSSTTSRASRASASPAAAVMAVVGVPLGAWRRASSTSVVVPVREMYTRRS